MPQESPHNTNNKPTKRFGGRRRNYVDTFRWGFVPEDESEHSAAKSDTKQSGRKKEDRPIHSDDSSDSVSKRQRSRPSKKAVKIESVKSVNAPKAKSEGIVTKHSAKMSAPQTPPDKHPSKRRKRSKSAIPQYASNNHYEEDEDLKLPSYGRTPIPSDDELPVPQKIVRKPAAKKAASVSAPLAAESDLPAASSSGFQPKRAQMVWDPDKAEYVPLVETPKSEPRIAKKPPKPDKRREHAEKASAPSTEKPVKKPAKTSPERLPKRSVPNNLHSDDPPPGKGKLETQRPSRPNVEERYVEERQPKPQKQSSRPAQNQKPKKAERADVRRETDFSDNPRKPSELRGDSRRNDSRRSKIPRFVESPIPDPMDAEAEVSGFAELGVSETMLEALKIVRYLEPTPIQAGVFQKVQAGVDLMGQAQTGTGKTAAFSMPIIEGVELCPPGNDPVALILVPTRELAVQVRDEAVRLAYGRDIHITACYGGKPLAKQIERLRSGIDILVGTPGRILDLMNRRALSLASLRWVVLDEADRMLDIGFRPDIEKILRQTPQERQTLLFSATLPPPVVRLAEKYMKSPEVLDFSNKSVAVDTIEQFYVTVDPERKFDALVYLLEEQQPRQAIIFTRTKRGADRLARLLSNRFEKLAAIHGDLAQSERDRVMTQVRSGSLRYLVATDVVGRGIDVSGISHIINYDVPKFCDDYVHRVGRTGRMGREGVAFTFVTVQEGSELTRIEMRIDKLLKRAELKGFESFTKPHDPNATLEEELPPEPAKPVFGKPVRKVRRAL